MKVIFIRADEQQTKMNESLLVAPFDGSLDLYCSLLITERKLIIFVLSESLTFFFFFFLSTQSHSIVYERLFGCVGALTVRQTSLDERQTW